MYSPHYWCNVMGELTHPETGDSIEVEIVDEETHGGEHFVQVESDESGVSLSDESDEQPWFDESEVEDE